MGFIAVKKKEPVISVEVLCNRQLENNNCLEFGVWCCLFGCFHVTIKQEHQNE